MTNEAAAMVAKVALEFPPLHGTEHTLSSGMATTLQCPWLSAVEQTFRAQKTLAEKAAGQMSDEAFVRRPAETFNSVAVIMRHVAGNLASRWRDFLVSDGEKPGRDRDSEFADWPGTRAELMGYWDAGWQTLFNALAALSDADAARTVAIRGEPHSVALAIERSLAHTAYHVGQIILLARLFAGNENWHWLTIPPGQSRQHNQQTWGTPASRGAV